MQLSKNKVQKVRSFKAKNFLEDLYLAVVCFSSVPTCSSHYSTIWYSTLIVVAVQVNDGITGKKFPWYNNLGLGDNQVR